MNFIFSRFFGLVLIVLAIAGLVLSIVGIFGVWNIRRVFGENLLTTLELTEVSLQTTADGLTLVDQSLTKAVTDVNSLERTIRSTGRAIQDTSPLVLQLTTLMGNDLPDTILATQTSLIAAQSSAQLIENVLTAVTSIPFIGGQRYAPPVPLHVALGEVSESLDPLQDSFASMESSLRTTNGNLIMIQAEFNIIARHIGQINTSLTEARFVVGEYQETVTGFQTQVHEMKIALPGWLNALAWFFTFAFIALAAAQLGLLVQGLQLVVNTPRA
jgi:hypothetical protein